MSTIDFGCILAMVVVCVVGLTMRLSAGTESAELGLNWWQNLVSAVAFLGAAACGLLLIVVVAAFSETARTSRTEPLDAADPSEPTDRPKSKRLTVARAAFALLGLGYSAAFGLFALRAWVVDSGASTADTMRLALWFTIAPTVTVSLVLAVVALIRRAVRRRATRPPAPNPDSGGETRAPASETPPES